MRRTMKLTALLAAVAAMALSIVGTALADGPGPNHAQVKGVITAIIVPAVTSTPSTVTIQPKEGSAVTVKVVASTVITKAGLGKVALDALAVDDRAEATYDKGNSQRVQCW